MLISLVLALVTVSLARADGEVGLVVQNGDQVTTYCIAYAGDGITGQDLLKKAGISIEAYGGGSGLAVCALGATGCPDSGSFASCFCQCQGGDCTYWAFFTRQYGKNWVYSSLAFNLLKAKDGDVHGWKWGKGGPNSAPAPQDITFNQVCGHDPRGGIAPTATLAPALASTQVPVPTAVATSNTAQPTVGGSPAPPDQPSVTQSPPGGAPTVTVTIARATDVAAATPGVPQAGAKDKGGDGGSGGVAYLAFGAIAVLLLGGAGFGLVWRQRHGA